MSMLEEMFLDGAPSSTAGRRLLAATVFFRPRFSKAAGCALVAARQLFKGSIRREPPKSRHAGEPASGSVGSRRFPRGRRMRSGYGCAMWFPPARRQGLALAQWRLPRATSSIIGRSAFFSGCSFVFCRWFAHLEL